MMSVVAKLSVTPGSMVSVAPVPTVRSPPTAYGEPASVSAVLTHSVP